MSNVERAYLYAKFGLIMAQLGEDLDFMATYGYFEAVANLDEVD